jgi:tetratricopeptide (TPR) repeat protein
MAHRHLDARLLDVLLRGEARAEEVRELVWHLLESCPDCARTANSEWALADHEGVCWAGSDDACFGDASSPSISPEAGDEFDVVFKRVEARIDGALSRLAIERSNASTLVSHLLALPQGRRRLLVFNNPRLQTLPVAELLLDSAWELGLSKPSEAEPLIELTLEVIARIDSECLSAELVNDVEARAWGVRGNFRRILADVRGAEEAFSRARELLALGRGDLLERARLLDLESTLRRMQMRLVEAGSLLDEALQIYRALGESHLAGRTMVSRALLLNEQGEPHRAIEALYEAQKLIDPQREPYLERIAQQNLVVYLSECGQYDEARRLIPGLRSRVIQDGTRAELLRLRWQEGKIHLGLGHDARAEAAFLEVRKGFLEQDLHYDVAAVSLELAALYMRQRRTGEIRELAAQMFPIFQSRDLHQEAIAALLLFQRAVEMDTLTLRMVEEVADVVRRSQEKPRPRAPEPS